MARKTPTATPCQPGRTPPIAVRNYRFCRDDTRSKGRDPVATAWFLALSASFPRGEAMFIAAVKLFRDGVPPKLEEEIRDFIRQEVNHSREHLAFNRLARDAGYDITAVERRIAALCDETLAKPPFVQLAVTMGLEHFTAIIANLFLRDPSSIVSDGIGDPDLWRWHAVEEIEHKGVAYDTWLHATREWSGAKRYFVRSLVMLRTTQRFLTNRIRDSLEIMAQDGVTGWSARWRLATYLLGRPGIIRRILPAWAGYFRPGFHPWDHDDSHLIAQWSDARIAEGASAERSPTPSAATA